MDIIQIEDKNLSHYSYVIISNGEAAIIDPARDPQPYYELVNQHGARIVAVMETHPHADFVSSHLEMHQTTGAVIYVSKLLGAEYEHTGISENDKIITGNISFRVLDTPGHSPDSVCFVLLDENDVEKAVFTGDTLFIGDCGRPDLREEAGAVTASREKLARQMYHSLRDKLMLMRGDVLVYPAHGAGSLCGRGLSSNNSSTIETERISNWSLSEMSEEDFVKELLRNQPFVPKYFGYDVELNKKGAPAFADAIAKIKLNKAAPGVFENHVIIDTRGKKNFNNGHFPNSINLMDDVKFETWLGSIISPGEKFYLQAEDVESLQLLVKRVAKIGYETQVEDAFATGDIKAESSASLDIERFRESQGDYTVLDIRNSSEVAEKRIFKNSISVPLYELRERVADIPTGKPIVVHCAGGYRSAAGASILRNILKDETPVYDLGEAIKSF